MKDYTIGVLFVCLGNICRSPLAENVFRERVERAGLADRFDVDSAGTSGWHDGQPPDARTAEEARRRGLELTGRSRRIRQADLDRFDYVVAMDANNREEVRALAEDAGREAGVRLLREFDPDADGELEVPDPYFGGEGGFAAVHDMVERSCDGLLAHIRAERGL